MIREGNKEEFQYLNITAWHEAGYKGQGMKIAVFDAEFDVKQSHLCNVVKPTNYDHWTGTRTYGDKNDSRSYHGEGVCDVINQIAPEAEIIVYNPKPESVKRAIEDGCSVLTMSLAFITRTVDGEEVDPNIFREVDDDDDVTNKLKLFVAAGNEGVEGSDAPANTHDWISTGATHLRNGEAAYVGYSAVDEHVKIASFSNIEAKTKQDGIRRFAGTSFATPVLAAMALLVQQKAGKEIPRHTFRQFMYQNCEDLESEGWDEKTGHGLFVLPDPNDVREYEPILDIVTWLGNTISYEQVKDEYVAMIIDGYENPTTAQIVDRIETKNIIGR